jgi:biotin---protein ligase
VFTDHHMLRSFHFGVIHARSAYSVRTAIISTRAAAMDQICVFGATPRELQQAQEHLSQAGPLTAGGKKKGSSDPPSTSTLSFHHATEETTQDCTICGSFDPSKYFSSLETSILGRTLFTAAATASTQAIIQENISKLPNGVLFVADKQLGGKGRGGNTWESPPGCLMFSTAYRLTISGQRLPFVQYLVTLAVVQAAQAQAYKILEHCFSKSTSAAADNSSMINKISRRFPLDIKIKWPNDIYAGGLKLGGILCHSSFRDGQFHVIMGVGVNVANKQPTTCIQELIEKKIVEILGQDEGAGLININLENIKISREVLLAEVMTRLEPMLLQLAEDGFKPFENDYYDAWLHSGQRVHLEEPIAEGGVGVAPARGGSHSNDKNFINQQMKMVGVTVRGLSPHGYLMAEDDAGEVYELHPDGNSFDFFKGLVRKKF